MTAPMTVPTELRSDRLLLRPTREQDADAILDLFADEETTRYWAHRPLENVSAALAWITSRLERRARGELLDWVAEADGGAVAGVCFLGDYSPANRRGEIGYALHRDLRGRGLANEMVARVLRHCFEDLDLHRIEADVDPRHGASLRLLERHGFVVEGHLRERWQATGELQDTVILGLLARDWRALASGSGR